MNNLSDITCDYGRDTGLEEVEPAGAGRRAADDGGPKRVGLDDLGFLPKNP